MKAITEIAEDHELAVIEDACQAHGANYRGKKVGSFGTGAFSFYPTKNMTTGEGGMLTTDDRTVAEKAEMIRAHGSSRRYLHEVPGFNFRMTDIAAAIGLVQLGKIEGFNSSRQENAKKLTDGLEDISRLKTPVIKAGCSHVFHQYTIRTEKRDELAAFLKEKGIGTGIHYPMPIHKQPVYQKSGYEEVYPAAEKAACEVLSLPVHPGLSGDEVKQVVSGVREFYGTN
jgi:dTDP-4-amino-4,6-dideoxygalactose transaminase